MQLNNFTKLKPTAAKIFSFMEKNKPGYANFTVEQVRNGKRFQGVMETEVGQGILADALLQMEGLEKRLLEEGTYDENHQQMHQRYLAYREIIESWARRIELYNKSMDNMFKEKKDARRTSKPR